VCHYAFNAAHLLILDVELAKAVMIKDFDHFTDRRSVHGLNEANPVNKIQMNMLTMLRGERWRTVRNAYSPIFTSGKLKAMTDVMNQVCLAK
jgi:cytochrome P450